MTTEQGRQYLVFGASGAQGGAVARNLVERGHPVRGFAHQGTESADPAVSLVTGDLADPDAVREAFAGVTHAAVTLPLVYDADTVAGYARNIADAARQAGVQQIVYNSNTCIPDDITPYPAYETRRAAEAILAESGVPFVVLRPPVYLENLFNPGVGGALVNQNVLAYPLPADRRVAWVSHDDLAAAMVAALDRPDLVGRSVQFGGGEVLTGPELAAIFSDVLGRPISYLQLEVDAFQEGLAFALGAEAAAGVSGIYRWVGQEAGRDLFDLDPATLPKVLNVTPTPVADWVAARPWQQFSQGEQSGRS
ncbi:NAD(P)H azoreductase [Micromonospora sp. MH33]|uniref:SDR family oxidoreductase n=1 Tax=Micromonospora sp. MH33 TaxID=1945509 RepID=UPI000D14B927|nr:NmrA family NAD(P)-binding protein [Micromonospora sp. MH33]PSK66855.1 NAD(P)H azoreductase [Micromonospora sp. MH33]